MRKKHNGFAEGRKSAKKGEWIAQPRLFVPNEAVLRNRLIRYLMMYFSVDSFSILFQAKVVSVGKKSKFIKND